MTQVTPPIVLLTRPTESSERLAATIRTELSLNSVISPVLRFERKEVSEKIDTFSALILTSPNGARYLADLEIPENMICYTVGDRTAQIVSELGLVTRSASGDSNDLVELVLGDPPAGKCLHLRGEHARGDISHRLNSAGVACEECVFYQQIAQNLTGEALELIHTRKTALLPLFSPRSAALVSAEVNLHDDVWVVAMSEAVADKLGAGFAGHVTVAERPDEAAMLDALRQLPPVRHWVEATGLQV